MVLVPPPDDGHPDRDARGTAALAAVHVPPLDIRFTPIWQKARGGDLRSHGTVVKPDSAETELKRLAMECYKSQIYPLGPDIVDGPVITRRESSKLLDGTEWMYRPRVEGRLAG